MALILGTNAYTTVSNFKAWCTLRGYELFDFTDSEIESAIVIASLDFLDTQYTFKGTKLDSSQVMQLPTNEVTISDIETPVCQAVWQHLNGLLFVDQSVEQSSGTVKKVREKVGQIESEVEYQDGSNRGFTHNLTLLNSMLKPFVIYSAGGLSVARG